MSFFDRFRFWSKPAEPPRADEKPQEQESDDALFPNGEPRELSREDVTQMVDAIYSRLSEADRAKITEDLWSRFEFDTPYARSYGQEKLGVPGKFTLLREWTWPERMDVLERAHQAWERNPLAKTGVGWTTRFVVGKGGSLTFHANEVKEVLEEFTSDNINNFKAYEREFCEALQVDGELFIRFFDNEQGRVVIIPIRPWHIHWIASNPQNYKEVISYHYVYVIYADQPGLSDFGTTDVPASQMLHVAINRLPYEMRGRPDLFSILPWLKAFRDWLEERARINRRKSIYYHMKLKNAQPGQVTTKANEYRKPPPPGSFLVTNDQVEFNSVQSNINADDASEDGRQIKLMAIAGMQEPEYFFADGANANLATATAQSLPALRKFEDYQDILAEQVWIPIFKRVIQNAVDAGRIDEIVAAVDSNGEPVMESITAQTVLHIAKQIGDGNLREAYAGIVEAVRTGTLKQKMIKAVDAFDYRYPELKEKDPHNLAQALQIAVERGWISNETATVQLGFDPAVERKKMDAERAARAEQGTANGNPPADDKRSKNTNSSGERTNQQPTMGDEGDRTLAPSDTAPTTN